MLKSIVAIFLLCWNGLSFSAESSTTKSHTVAILDAGSSGTRVHFYTYNLDEHHFPVNVVETWGKKVSPGLSTLSSEQSAINAYLEILFADAPLSKNTKVYLYATAGMRMLPHKTQKQYYDMVKHWFDALSPYHLMEARTLAGREEAVLGWISVNYQADNFGNAAKPLGVMDIGGASVQIAFPVSDAALASDETVQLDLYGHRYALFAHSFLGLGQNEFTHQYMDEPSCYPDQFELPSGDAAHGNARDCQNRAAVLIGAVHQVDQVVQTMLQKNEIKTWYTIGGLTNIMSADVYKDNKTEFTPKVLLDKADQAFCQENWEQLEKKYSKNIYIAQYCIVPSAYYALFVHGYGLSETTPIHLLPSDKNSDWTVGAVIYDWFKRHKQP